MLAHAQNLDAPAPACKQTRPAQIAQKSVTLSAMDAMTLLARLEKMFPGAKKTTLREMVQNKRVRINGAVARSVKTAVADADRVEVSDTGAAAVETVTLAEGLKLIHFDADIVVIDKPPGLLTATDAAEKRPTAWRILREYFARQNNRNRIHLVHRLDRDASGLLVFARTREALASLKRQFFAHTVTRRYDAIVHGVPRPAAGRLERLLAEHPRTGVMAITLDPKKGKLAAMDYQIVQQDPQRGIAHVRCTLFTGRKHQIRVLMKSIGHPVCGDPVYGNAGEPPGRLALHASHLAIDHPGNAKRTVWESPMPGSFAHLFRAAHQQNP